MFSIDQVARIEDDVEAVLVTERKRYDSVYDVVEKYTSEFSTETSGRFRGGGLYVGGTMGVNLLLHRARSLDDYVYELYSEDAFEHANNMTNRIAEHIRKEDLGFYVVLLTKIPNRTYEIHVDDRRLIYLTNLDRGKRFAGQQQTFTSWDLIKPIQEKSYAGYPIQILSPEVYLVGTYRTLSSPNEIGNWPEQLRNETKLFQLMKPRLDILGGADEEVDAELDTSSSNKDPISREEQKKIEQAILMKFVNRNKSCVLIGEHALRVVNQHEPFTKDFHTSSMVVQLISGDSPEDITQTIKEIVHNAIGREILVLKSTKSVPILDDFRLNRTTIKVGPEGLQKEILYVYNSSDYDLIPYNTVIAGKEHKEHKKGSKDKKDKKGKKTTNTKKDKDKTKDKKTKKDKKDKKSSKDNDKKDNDKDTNFIQIGTPFVLLRFVLINIWVVRWINKMGMMNDDFARKRLANLLKSMIDLRAVMQDSKIDIKTMSTVYVDKTGHEQEERLMTNIRDDLFGSKSVIGIGRKEYIGQFISDMLAIKKERKESSKKNPPPYYPQRNYLADGKYRELRTTSTKK